MINKDLCGLDDNYLWSSALKMLFGIQRIKKLIINNYKYFDRDNSLTYLIGIILQEMCDKNYIPLQHYDSKLCARIGGEFDQQSSPIDKFAHVFKKLMNEINDCNSERCIEYSLVNMDKDIFNGNDKPIKEPLNSLNVINYQKDVIILSTKRNFHKNLLLENKLYEQDDELDPQIFTLSCVLTYDLDKSSTPLVEFYINNTYNNTNNNNNNK